jgi:hypothetical protein
LIIDVLSVTTKMNVGTSGFKIGPVTFLNHLVVCSGSVDGSYSNSA